MGSISTAAEAVARIAYLTSDFVLSVQSLTDGSSFAHPLDVLEETRVCGIFSQQIPEIRRLPQNADPLFTTFEPLQSGRAVAVVTSSNILLGSIPHLYRLANTPVVIHVCLEPIFFADYSVISSIRQCGFSFLHSESNQEAQDIALTAHVLASKSGKGVIHFFDSASSSQDQPIIAEDIPLIKDVFSIDDIQLAKWPASAEEETLYADSGRVSMAIDRTSVEEDSDKTPTEMPAEEPAEQMSRPVDSSDIFYLTHQIWDRMAKAVGRHYHVVEYVGPSDAISAMFIFGSTRIYLNVLQELSSEPDFKTVGLIFPRLYRPWVGSQISRAIPSTIKRIAVLEQARKTTKWSPSLLDLLASLDKGGAGPLLVGYRSGYVEPSTARQAVKGIFQNLTSDTPIQNLEIGQRNTSSHHIQNAPVLRQPIPENSYMKILKQLFDDHLYIANQVGAQHAGISATIAASPEYGFGSLLSRIDRQNHFVQRVREAVKAGSFASNASKDWLSRWVLAFCDGAKATALAPEVILQLNSDESPLAKELLGAKNFFSNESRWLIGSDAWAYDLGNSGVHHVLASGANVNMLIIDSQPYSQRVAADASRRKKDIGLYAMNFGNAYVASVAVYSSYTQVLHALTEANRYEGPSVVLAYLPYWNEDESPLTILQETKKAVDLGYWPLYRWNPNNAEKGQPNFSLDSERIRRELEQFLKRDNQLTLLSNRHPNFSNNLSGSYGTEVRNLQKRAAKDAYDKLLEGLFGAPLTILFASDNGNAQGLAKRLGNRGRSRGLKTLVLAMDDYPIEDLATEENVVFITSTAGQGEFPQNGHNFWQVVKNSGDLDLSNINYSVFGLGDSHYWPRKQDKIYYNKPSKDLDSRISFLGAKKLTDLGLGDDQDPDAFQTGYSEWEPRLWEALGVDKVEGLPEEPAPLTNEDIKIQSNFLRGTINEGLEDTTTGAISAADQQLTKFHGTYMQDDRDVREERKAQGLEPAYGFMIRCRLPGGVATPSQWLQMDEIASTRGNETMKLTTRQTFQFHGVIKGKLRAAMRDINKALMTTLAACGDVNRNVMCSSLPELSEYHRETQAVAKKVSDHLLPSTSAYHEIWLKDEDNKKVQVAGDAIVDHEPLYGPTYLPRKFKVTIAIPPHNDTDVFAHDVGLIAIKDKDGHLAGFNVTAGGGMGVTHNNKKTYPRTGSMLGYVSASQTPVVCEKIMTVQRDHGDRKNRKHARLKYTMDDMGVEIFKAKVEALLPEGITFGEPRPYKFKSNIDTFGWQKDEKGRHHFTFFIENGRIEDTASFPMRTGLRELAKLNKGEFRLTGNQHLILSNIEDIDLATIKFLLAKYKLDNTSFSGLRLSSSACVAFPTCGLAMAESERYLPVLIGKLESCLEENGLGKESIVMRMTGCPNGCARPWLAELAFVGKAYGAYNMYLGGGYYGQRLNKLYRSSIKEDEILDIVRDLFRRYSQERLPADKASALDAESGRAERFGDWCIRAGIIKETTEGKYFHEGVAEEDED